MGKDGSSIQLIKRSIFNKNPTEKLKCLLVASHWSKHLHALGPHVIIATLMRNHHCPL